MLVGAALDAARRVSRQRRRSSRDRALRDGTACALRTAIRRCSPSSSATRSRPTSSAGTGPSGSRGFLRELVGLIKAAEPDRAGQLRQFPVDRVPRRSISPTSSASTSICTTSPRSAATSRGCTIWPVDRPLVLTEFGVDSLREGETSRRDILSWQVRAAFAIGVAGTFVFAWTDEWFTGGASDRGLGVRPGRSRPPAAKPALRRGAARGITGPLPPPLPRYPRVSVVVCAYNAERTMEACLASLENAQLPRLRGHRRQ